MAKHKFHLESVVTLRERQRDAAAASYREALAAKEKLQTQVEALMREHAEQQPLQWSSISGRVDSQRLIESQRYQLHLLQMVSTLRSQIEMVESECEKRRLVLVTAEQSLTSLEKLRDKQQAAWENRQIEREQLALDQWSGFKYWKESQSS